MGAVTTARSWVFFFIFMCTCHHLFLHCLAHYDAIYQFGDSMADAGNYIRLDASRASSRFTRLPYGQTYFNKPTGRPSDGRLMIDFLAQELGLPLLKPYLQNNDGVNFAVGGATAVDTDLLDNLYNITIPDTNISLAHQLDWFFCHLDSICPNQKGCNGKMKNALFVVGSIGANDYSYPFYVVNSLDKVKPLVPYVVRSIKHAVQKLIERGATSLIVPGTFAMGCFPNFLTSFKANDSTYYDNTGCLKDYNKFAEYHNKYLKATLSNLRKKNPDVVIVYADYYNAFQSIVSSGIEKEYIVRACCGAGGEYNVDTERPCGDEGAVSCTDPYKYMSWDGSHYSEMAFKLMFEWMLTNNFSSLKI